MTPTHWLERTELLIKPEGIARLQQAHVLVVGLGGVGSFAAEFIVRAGVGNLTIVDGDVVDSTNRNRQLPALSSTIGKPKATIMANRLLDINPELNLKVIEKFVVPDQMHQLITATKYDYIIEAIDSLTPKLTLIETAYRHKIKIISSMGAGGKTDPNKVQIADISQTRECPLSKYTRKRLRRRGISKGIKVVFSDEAIQNDSMKHTDGSNYKKSFYGTISYMPALFGLRAAAEVIQYLTKKII